MEKEYCGGWEFGFKDNAISDEGTFEGYASTFGNVDLGGDIVMPGAFTRTLKSSSGKVPILNAHRSDQLVGLNLDASEDDRGLKVHGKFLINTDLGRNAAQQARDMIAEGHKLGLSIGYRVFKDGSEWDEQTGIRKLKSIELLEYSIAPVPMNPKARMTRVKNFDRWTVREFEEHLRDAGFSVNAAREITSRGFKAFVDSRDADSDAKQTDAAAAFMQELRGASLLFELRNI